MGRGWKCGDHQTLFSKPNSVSQKESSYLERMAKNKGHIIPQKSQSFSYKFITRSLSENCVL